MSISFLIKFSAADSELSLPRDTGIRAAEDQAWMDGGSAMQLASPFGGADGAEDTGLALRKLYIWSCFSGDAAGTGFATRRAAELEAAEHVAQNPGHRTIVDEIEVPADRLTPSDASWPWRIPVDAE